MKDTCNAYTIAQTPYFTEDDSIILTHVIDQSTMTEDLIVRLPEAKTDCSIGQQLTYTVNLAEAMVFTSFDEVSLSLIVHHELAVE